LRAFRNLELNYSNFDEFLFFDFLVDDALYFNSRFKLSSLKNRNAYLGRLPKIAVLRLSALGDVVLCASMVLHLVKSGKFEISWITTKQTKDLLGKIDGVEFIIVPKPKNVKKFLECRDILKNREFDCLVLAQASFSAHFVSINVKSKRKIGFDSSRSKDFHRFFIDECIDPKEEHFVDAYFNFSSKLDLPKPRNVEWAGLFTDQSRDKLFANEFPPGQLVMAVNPSASKPERNWGQKSYAKVINYVQGKGIKVVLTGGGGHEEKQFNNSIFAMCENPPLNMTGDIQLGDLPYLIKNTSFLLAPDTGTVHIARAVGLPVIGLYAIANPALTGPYQASEFSIEKHKLALTKFNKSKNNSFHSRVHNDKAMNLISVNDVIVKVDEVLKSLSAPKNLG
jgi:heptosyltransferase I